MNAYILTFERSTGHYTKSLIVTDKDIGIVASNNRGAIKIEKVPVNLILVNPDLPY
jgi:hypothetical protein